MLSPNGFPFSPLGRGIACETSQAYITAETKKRNDADLSEERRVISSHTARRERELAMARISLNVNGTSRVVDTDPTTPLLYVLRDDLGLNGPKFGCGLSQCGACTVLMDGNTARSCTIPVSAARNHKITTLEGLGSVAHPHWLQKAFIEEQAAQCGYCMNGIVLTAKVLLDKNPKPTDAEIKKALDNNLCRCGSHLRVIRAIKRAAQERA
jgi:nicotinate dehydrogenase subunit A